MKKNFLVVFILLIYSLAQAHEFWMQPSVFKVKQGDRVVIDFMVGENFTGEFWNLKRHRVEELKLINQKSTEDLSGVVSESQGENLALTCNALGTQLIAMKSNNAFIELEADKFNAYLKEDGIEDILKLRTETNTLDKPAKEFYARCAKVLLQVGDLYDDTYKKVTGMPLEIVPLSHPYKAKVGEEVKFQLLFKGEPLPFSMIKVWNRKDNQTILQNLYTEKDGIVRVRLGNTGSWMISSVKMIASSNKEADWQSYWTTYVFGL